MCKRFGYAKPCPDCVDGVITCRDEVLCQDCIAVMFVGDDE